jgi:hypothetical protein
VDFGNDRDSYVASLAALPMDGADPCFDCATRYKRHIKLGAGSGRRTIVEFAPGRLGAPLQSHVDAVVLHVSAASMLVYP